MAKHPAGLRSIERQLRIHDLRLAKLRAWLSAILAALSKCNEEGGTRAKSLDGTPDPRTLEYERDTIEREIRAHEILVALGRDRHALEVLEEVAGDASLAREAAPDPRAFAEARGIRLPRHLLLKVNVAGERVSIRLDYVERSCAVSLTFP